MWNGTAATLNAKPTMSNARPPIKTPLLTTTFFAKNAAISPRLVEPVAP